MMLAWKIAPALACGNTVVLKPAHTTPLSALLFCDVLRQAELPPGVVNILTGDGRTGAELVRHPGVNKIAFTGSTEVGKEIQRAVAGTGKRVTLELGGKAANIVFDDAPLDQAVEGIVNGIYFNQGEVCCAGSRLLVQESVADDVIGKLKRRMGTLRVGDPLDKNTDVGAINSREQLDRISELVESGREEGAEIYQPPCRLPDKGFWFAPTVFTEVAQSYRIAQEEIFGPVLSVLTFRTPDEALEKANNTPYGLSAGVWTEKGSRISGWPSGCAPALSGRTRTTASTPRRPSAATRSPASAARAGSTASRPTWSSSETPGTPLRLPVKKTYKLYIGGEFPRSESGRSYEVDGQNVARASRKDLRDAVRAARAAFPGWAGRTAYNRGQVLYRMAEMMEARRADLAAVCSGGAEVDLAIDRMVWYAGWADKLAQVLGSANPVAGPYFNFTIPEPTGVVGILAPEKPPLAGLITRLAPAIVGGNTVVTVASEARPLAAVELAEALATSDLPGGVVNLLTGQKAELAPWLAAHMDVNAIDVGGADGQTVELEQAAAENVKRVVRGTPDEQSPWEIAAFLELKTVWHPIGR